MAKTKLEVIAEAHRRLAVLSVDEQPSTDMVSYASGQADALFAELQAEPFNMVFAWDMETVPDNLWRPLSWLLATDIAPQYQVAPPESRAKAWTRFAQAIYVDDREDRRDADDDGIIDEDEAQAGLRAQYY